MEDNLGYQFGQEIIISYQTTNFDVNVCALIFKVDATGNFWATCFQNEAEHILGETASRLGSVSNSNLTRLVEVREAISWLK